MAAITSALIGIALGLTQDRTRTYEDRSTDLILTYPESWKMEKQRYATVFQFPVQNENVIVRILKTDQRYPAEHWQSSVKMVEETNGNEVLEQWTEDLLGVPLLMTRYREQRGAVRSIVLVGLLYAKTPEKMSFRVIAPETVAQEAEQVWRNVLVSARTVSGKLPEREEPGSAAPVEVVPPGRERPTKSVTIGGNSAAEAGSAYKGPVRVTADADRGLFAYLPEGFTLDGTKLKPADGSWTLEMAYGVGDLESSKAGWLRQCSMGRTPLTTVERRHEPKPKVGAAGFTLMEMVRTGRVEETPSVQLVVLGWSGGLAYTAEFRGSADQWKTHEAAIRDVLGKFSVSSS